MQYAWNVAFWIYPGTKSAPTSIPTCFRAVAYFTFAVSQKCRFLSTKNNYLIVFLLHGYMFLRPVFDVDSPWEAVDSSKIDGKKLDPKNLFLGKVRSIPNIPYATVFTRSGWCLDIIWATPRPTKVPKFRSTAFSFVPLSSTKVVDFSVFWPNRTGKVGVCICNQFHRILHQKIRIPAISTFCHFFRAVAGPINQFCVA